MTEPNNTPNDSSDQESLDDVLRGLSSEGSEEEQSLDDILASLSEDASEETLPAESLDTNALLSDINDLKSDTFVEPPLSSSPEPEPAASSFNLNAMPSVPDSILADSADLIDDEVIDPIRSEASEQASPFDASIPSPSIDESVISDTFASDMTDVVSESTAEPTRGWGDESLSAGSQIPDSLSEMGTEAGMLNDSPLSEPEELISFENADSSSPIADVPPVASPFEPSSSSAVDDIGSPFAIPADTLESPFVDAKESAAEPSSSWGDASSGAESQIPESISEFSGEPEPLPDSPLPTPEEATPFDVNADVTPPSPFETPVTPPPPGASTSPFSEPASDVEPAFTSFVGADNSMESPSAEPPIEEAPLAGESESVDVVDEPWSTSQPSVPASEPEVSSGPEVSAWGAAPNLIPETPAPEPEVPAAAFNPPESTIEEPTAPEPVKLNDSDPDLAGPELPSLPPLTQTTFSETGESLSQASIDSPKPAAINSDSDEPMNLKSLLDRPRHRWLVPFGFIMILVIFGGIIFGALRGNQESDPAPETQEQSSRPSLTHGSS